MAWIRVTPTQNDRAIYVNTNQIVYIAEPPAEETEEGVGAGISFSDDTRNVLPVKESLWDIMNTIERREEF